jgi:hypothetical protein
MSKLETNTIDTISGSTNLTLGGTNATDITIPSGVTITNNGTQSGFGGTMTPAFFAYSSAVQAVSDNTYTKVQINTEEYDTNNCYDNTTNYRFTPTVAGKYFFYGTINLNADPDGVVSTAGIAFYKNGSALYGGTTDVRNQTSTSEQISISASFDMNGSTDYVELYGRIDVVSGTPRFLTAYQGDNRDTYFGAYKIIE